MLKVAVTGLLAWWMVKPHISELERLATLDPAAILPFMYRHAALAGVRGDGVLLVITAAADWFVQKQRFSAKMRMSKEELKEEIQEHRGRSARQGQAEADAQAERARRRMMQAVPNATVVVMNPTHYAVALKYVQGEDAAPVCVAKGMDAIALKIRDVAEERSVPVIEDPPLARALYAAVEIDERDSAGPLRSRGQDHRLHPAGRAVVVLRRARCETIRHDRIAGPAPRTWDLRKKDVPQPRDDRPSRSASKGERRKRRRADRLRRVGFFMLAVGFTGWVAMHSSPGLLATLMLLAGLAGVACLGLLHAARLARGGRRSRARARAPDRGAGRARRPRRRRRPAAGGQPRLARGAGRRAAPAQGRAGGRQPVRRAGRRPPRRAADERPLHVGGADRTAVVTPAGRTAAS